MEKANKKGREALSGGRFVGWGAVSMVASFVAVALLTAFAAGLWYGGWMESVKLRSALEEIPDINSCFE